MRRVHCECGCGTSYPPSQIVVRRNSYGREFLYIPHALDLMGLFRPPQEIRVKLDACQVGTHEYILPGDDFYACALAGCLPDDFVRHESQYGPYWVRTIPRIRAQWVTATEVSGTITINKNPLIASPSVPLQIKLK